MSAPTSPVVARAAAAAAADERRWTAESRRLLTQAIDGVEERELQTHRARILPIERRLVEAERELVTLRASQDVECARRLEEALGELGALALYARRIRMDAGTRPAMYAVDLYDRALAFIATAAENARATLGPDGEERRPES